MAPAKKLDSTAKDLDQDEIEQADTKKSQTDIAALERRIAQLETDVRTLAPLAELLGAVTQIRRHFGVV